MSEQTAGEVVSEQEKDSSDELIIDLEPDGTQSATKKRKRTDINESEDDESNTTIESIDSIDDNLASVAKKNNLTPAHVKSILKKVVLNEHVMAVVMLRGEEEETKDKTKEELKLEPKLTRAKTKKLKTTAATNVSWPLSPLTPIKVPISVSPEVNSLISEELIEEESDEEYEPTFEEHSDDEKETVDSSDVESLPRTPASPYKLPLNTTIEDEVKYSDDGVFKVPKDITIQDINKELDATIALRTRSKLCLSDIPIEKIEENFIPPDFTDTDEIDDVWRDFLEEFSKPLTNVNEEDDEADPEYNAATEVETFDNDELREELRVDNGVRVSQRELKDLVGELLEDINGILDIDPQNFVSSIGEIENPGKLENVEQSDPMYVPHNGEDVFPKVEYNNANVIDKTIKIEHDISNNQMNKMVYIGDDHQNISSPSRPKLNPVIPQTVVTSDGKLMSVFLPVAVNNTEVVKKVLPEISSNNANVIDKTIKIEHDISNNQMNKMVYISDDHQNISNPSRPKLNPVIPQTVMTSDGKLMTVFLPVAVNNTEVVKKVLPEISSQLNKKTIITKEMFPFDKIILRPDLFNIPVPYDKMPCEEDICLTHKQRELLDQQMRQHVQLATQCYLQLYGHPTYWALGPKVKECLMTLKFLAGDTPNSAFRPCNLLNSIALCEKWEQLLANDTPEMREFMKFINYELERMERYRKRKTLYTGQFPTEFCQIILDSNAFPYLHLIPRHPFRLKFKKVDLLDSEMQLLAMGLEQFYAYMNSNRNFYSSSKYDPMGFTHVSELIIKHMMPCRNVKNLKYYIRILRKEKEDNPVKHYFMYGVAPPTTNEIYEYNVNKTVRELLMPRKPDEALSWKYYNSRKEHPINIPPQIRVVVCSDEIIETAVSDSEVIILSESEEPDINTSIVEEIPRQPPDNEFAVQTDPAFLRIRSAECQHVCDCSVCDDRHTETVLKNQTFITDYFGKKCTQKLKSDRRSRAVLTRLLRLASNAVLLQSFNVQQKDKFLTVEHLKQRLKAYIADLDADMLPSMPFLLANSRDCITRSDDPDERIDSAQIAHVSDGVVLPKKKIDDKTVPKPSNPIPAKQKLAQRVGLKAQRELEANRAMFVTKDPYVDDLNETLYAAAYLDKVKTCLAKNDGDVSFQAFQNILNDFNPSVDTPTHLYNKIEKFFGAKYSDLTEEFLTFLTPGQANEIGRFMDYFMLMSMSDFIERLQIYFANKPAQLRKVSWTLERLAGIQDSELTTEMIKNHILPLLKGNQYLTDWFLKLFPDEKPPESLTNSGFEIIDCDKLMKENYDEGSSGSGLEFEHLDLPPVEENYGNESCTCTCHSLSNDKYKNKSRHCIGCGMRYIQGRVYVQHGRVLRGVHLNWQDAKDQARRLSVPVSKTQLNSRKRSEPQITSTIVRNDSDEERVSPKRHLKILRTPVLKSKHSKTAHCSRSLVPVTESVNTNQTSKSNVKVLKDSNIGIEEDMIEICEEFNKQREIFIKEELKKRDMENSNCESNKELGKIDVDEQLNSNKNLPVKLTDIKLENNSENEDDNMGAGSSMSNNKSAAEKKIEQEAVWTREEDKIILTILRNNNDDELMSKFKVLLPHRSEEEIRTRFRNVMELFKKFKL